MLLHHMSERCPQKYDCDYTEKISCSIYREKKSKKQQLWLPEVYYRGEKQIMETMFQLLWGGILVSVLKQNIQLYDIVYNKST